MQTQTIGRDTDRSSRWTTWQNAAGRLPSRGPSAPVSRPRLRVQVVEVTEDGAFAQDLLPWADPYIASLMDSLERERGE